MNSVQYSVQCTVYREVTSQDLIIGDSVQESCKELKRRMQEEVRKAERRTPVGKSAEYDSGVASSKKSLDKEVEDFLKRLDLEKLNKKLILLKGWFGVLHKERAICQAFKPSLRFVHILFTMK